MDCVCSQCNCSQTNRQTDGHDDSITHQSKCWLRVNKTTYDLNAITCIDNTNEKAIFHMYITITIRENKAKM